MIYIDLSIKNDGFSSSQTAGFIGRNDHFLTSTMDTIGSWTRGFVWFFCWEKTMYWFIIITGWWFQAFVIFHNIWDNPSHWLIFFRGVETTNQIIIHYPYLVGGLEPWHFMTFHILGMSSSQLTNSIILRRGRATTIAGYFFLMAIWGVNPPFSDGQLVSVFQLPSGKHGKR